MKELTAGSDELARSPGVANLLPPIRLVHAFKESAEASKPQPDASDEALALEVLLIAAHSAFAALSGLEDLFHKATYADSSSVRLVDPGVVEDGYHVWLDATDSLLERLSVLENHAYQSESFARFWDSHAMARSFLSDAQERRRLEREAPRNDRLARLAEKFKTSQTEDSARETGR